MCVPKKSMPCCFGSPTDLILRVRNGPLLVPRARTGRVPTNEGVFPIFALISVSRGVYTPKKWMSIFTFIDGFPIKLIVFCRSPPGICAVSTKKRDVSFHYEKQVSPVQGMNFPYWPL